MIPRKIVFLLCCAVFGSAVFNTLIVRRNSSAQTNQRVVRLATSSGPIAGTVSVPVELVSRGDENAIGFSLSYDAAVLGNPMAFVGADASGAGFNVNTNQAAQGRIGIALALPANQKFSEGVRQIVVVTFAISATATFGTTTINFSDLPVSREISDANAKALPAVYTNGIVTITKGFEADVNPRPDGDNNGVVTITDWVQLGRFVAGLETPDTGNEFQRADCAPRDTLGDGRISITDWTQAGRYAAALDSIPAAGGPTMPSQASLTRQQYVALTQTTSRIHGQLFPQNNQTRHLTIELEALGVENALGFSLSFNSSEWRLVRAFAGKDARGATLHANISETQPGSAGFVMALPAGKSFAAGKLELINCIFEPVIRQKVSPLALNFSDQPVKREIASLQANVINADYLLEGSDAGILTNVSAASFAGGEFAPEQIVSAFGDNLAMKTESASSFPLPASLAATSVKIADNSGTEHAAPLFFVSPAQINYLIPADAAAGTATVTVINDGKLVSIGSIEIVPASPGLFTANADGQGVAAAVALRVGPDGSQQFEPVSQFDAAREKFIARALPLADDGQQLYLILFGTGWRHATGANSARIRIGDQLIQAIYCGRQSDMAGLDQINLLLPSGMRVRGDLKLELSIDGKSANHVWLNFADPVH